MSEMDFTDIKTIEDAMRYIGERGNYVLLRYDPERTEKRFTVLVTAGSFAARVDTDEPREGFVQVMRKLFAGQFEAREVVDE